MGKGQGIEQETMAGDVETVTRFTSHMLASWVAARPEATANQVLAIHLSAAAAAITIISPLLAREQEPTRESILLACCIVARGIETDSLASLESTGDKDTASLYFDCGAGVIQDALTDFSRLSNRDPDEVFSASFLAAVRNVTTSADSTLVDFLSRRRSREIN